METLFGFFAIVVPPCFNLLKLNQNHPKALSGKPLSLPSLLKKDCRIKSLALVWMSITSLAYKRTQA